MGKVFIYNFEAYSYSFFQKVATKVGKGELEGDRKFRVTTPSILIHPAVENKEIFSWFKFKFLASSKPMAKLLFS